MCCVLCVTLDAARVVDRLRAYAGVFECCFDVLGERRRGCDGRGHVGGHGRGDAEQHAGGQRERDDHGHVDAVGRGDHGQHS